MGWSVARTHFALAPFGNAETVGGSGKVHYQIHQPPETDQCTARPRPCVEKPSFARVRTRRDTQRRIFVLVAGLGAFSSSSTASAYWSRNGRWPSYGFP